MNKENVPKILMYDIEWKPATAYVWKCYDENVSPDQLIDPGGLLCFSAQWYGSNETLFYSEWEDGHEGMVRALYDLFCQADALITFNGDRYDNKKALGEFLLAGLPPPPIPTSIDLLKTVKKMGFIMNRLAFIAPYLKIGNKIKNEGFPLWSAVIDGDHKAQRRMKKYCIQDTKLLNTLYRAIRPYIYNHPNFGHGECGACGHNKLHSRGFRRTKTFKIQRLQCQSCGSWSDGKRTKHG